MSKRSLALLCMGLGWLPVAGLAADSAAQQRALEVLRRTIAEQEQTAPMANPPPLQRDPKAQQRALEVLRRTETQPAAPQPAARQPVSPAAPQVAPRDVTEAQRRALEVLRRTTTETPAAAPARRPVEVPPEVSETLRRTEPGPVRTLAPAITAPELQLPPVDARAQQRALEVLRRTVAEQERAERASREPQPLGPTRAERPPRAARPPAPEPARPPAVREPAPAPRATPAQEPPPAVAPPIVQTPADIPPADTPPERPQTKVDRLRDLLERYRADEIGPAEYHAERARILAEP